MPIISDLSDLVIEQVSVAKEVTITVRAASPTAPCPCCGTISKRIQSRYTRTLRDLPASGRPVHLVVHVRRFFCQESTCVRKIFAERFPALTVGPVLLLDGNELDLFPPALQLSRIHTLDIVRSQPLPEELLDAAFPIYQCTVAIEGNRLRYCDYVLPSTR